MTSQQLRQRRMRILKEKFQEEKEQEEWQELSQQGFQRGRQHMTKIYVVVLSALVVTIMAILNHIRPAFLFRRKSPPPPLSMATLLPPSVITDRDLPRFFRTFSIATPNNKHARRALIHVAKSRRALNHGTGNLKVILKAWDHDTIARLIERNICGADFEVAYRLGTQERKNDLLTWCLLTTRIAEGFFQESVEMMSNAFLLNKKRGFVVVKADSGNRLSNAFYIHPRLTPEDVAVGPALLPEEVLRWLLDHPEPSLENPVVSLQEKIYQLVSQEEQRDRYMHLDEICQDAPPTPDRAIARQCAESSSSHAHHLSDGNQCCYFVVRQAEGGTIRMPSIEMESQQQKRSLRELSHRKDAKYRL